MAQPAGPPADPPPRSATRFAPLFVLAPARSFSSLVVAMLGQHPELYGFPELRLFRAERVGGLLSEPAPGTGMPARERTAGLVRALAQTGEGVQSAAAVERAWRWLAERADWEVALVFDHLLGQVEPLVGVEKSPENSLTDEALARACVGYPAARYVHLVRHPWTTVASMTTAWNRLSYWPVAAERAAQFCAQLWLDQHRRIAAFGERIGPDRFVRLRAEDVVNRAEVLPRLCRWLGISDREQCVAEMLRP
ncbi:MAG TPA: sulfotransferase, partial [Jatrophihabitans sp.]